MFQKLPCNSQKMLDDILAADNPVEMLQNRFEACSSQEDDELRRIMGELVEKGYIEVMWANNVPYHVLIKNSARTYHEQLAEYEQIHGITHSIATNENSLRSKVNNLIQQGKEIGQKEYHPKGKGVPYSYVSGPLYDIWMNEVNIFNERYLTGHPLYERFHDICTRYKKVLSAYDDVMGLLQALIRDNDFLDNSTQLVAKKGIEEMNNKIFIVYGHDEGALETTARFLERAGFEAIILREQPDDGLTIIEKIEQNTDVAFAVVLYTECDIGRDKNSEMERYRARQNVVFEHGYLVAKLGRKNVCPIVKGNVETPGDIAGVVYTSMDDAGAWKIRLAQNMKSTGLAVDFNKIL